MKKKKLTEKYLLYRITIQGIKIFFLQKELN